MTGRRARRTFLAGAFATLGGAPALGAPEGTAPGRPLLNVADFGAVGDGKADDTSAFREALAAAKGRSLLVPTPRRAYRITSTLRVGEGTALIGQSRLTTRIRMDADEPLISLGPWTTLCALHLDGNGSKAVGISVTGAEGQQVVEHCRITDFDAPCIQFGVGAGSGFSCVSCVVFRRGDEHMGTGNAAIVIEDAPQTLAVPRKFMHLETGGRDSFAFGGSNSTYIANSFLSDLQYSDNTRATLITNCRIAARAPIVVRGGQNGIVGCDVYPEVALGEGAGGCVVGPNSYNNPPVVDRSGNPYNLVYCPEVRYAPELSSEGTTTLGDGSIAGRWSREGNVVSAAIRLVTGRLTVLGTGALRLSLPPNIPIPAERGSPCGQARIAGGDVVAWARLYRPPGASYVVVEAIDGSAARTSTWPPGTVLEAEIRWVL